MTPMGQVLFVIAVMQLACASANFFDKFIQNEPDHTSQNGNYPQA